MTVDSRQPSPKAHKPKPDHPWVRNSYESMQRRKQRHEQRQKDRGPQ